MLRQGNASSARTPLRSLALLWALIAIACSGPLPERDLRDLVVRDSTYYVPETMEPYTGRVYRRFADDSTELEIVGALLDGTWHGELIVYHPTGRIRYMGSFAHGHRCGPWTENATDRDAVDIYDALTSDIEAMAIYPPCPPDLP